jgi:hypothetical protein
MSKSYRDGRMALTQRLFAYSGRGILCSDQACNQFIQVISENKKAPKPGLFHRIFGSSTWARTRDLRINSPALYQLSYRGSEALNYSHIVELLAN